jgi:hypothetical protein
MQRCGLFVCTATMDLDSNAVLIGRLPAFIRYNGLFIKTFSPLLHC